MNSLKAVKSNIESHKSMKALVDVYEEMAAVTMRNIREAILASRDYYKGLAQLSASVGSDLSTLSTTQTKDRAIVLLSANEGMYGDIVDKVIGSFASKIKETSGADIFVAGKVGEELMAVIAPGVAYEKLTLPKLGDDSETLTRIVKQLFPYRSVELFFGQFESIARQEPISRVLSAGVVEMTKDRLAGDVSITLKYLYEPSIEKISVVFGQQIFSGIVEQAVKEGELAKNASRLMHLDQALINIDKKIDIDTKHYRVLHKRLSETKQHTQLAGYKAIKRVKKMYV